MCTVYWYIGKVQTLRCCRVYDGVCRTEGLSLLLAKGCDTIAALTR
jgi:hypothetical protein